MSKYVSGTALAAAAGLFLGVSSGASAQEIALDGIIVTSSKVEEKAVDALSASSAVSREVMDQQFSGAPITDVLNTVPGVTTLKTGSDPATSINIRGLQDFGRVNVLVEGARQDFQRSGHSANGSFYLEPEMLSSVDVTRGPSSMIYGSGAIGGVVAFRLLNADDILRDGERAAVRTKAGYGTNDEGLLGSAAVAMRSGNFDIVGQSNHRETEDYKDGAGNTVKDTGEETTSHMLNARWRPLEGHQITGTLIDYTSDFTDRQVDYNIRRDSKLDNRQYTLGYTFSRPDSPLLDFSAKIYRNETDLDQTRINNSTGALTNRYRNFNLVTEGFDINNTSRFGNENFKFALTYGGDGVYDKVTTIDADALSSSPSNPQPNALTPQGKRSLEGVFVQNQLTMYNFIDVITALRYDQYKLESDTTNSSGDRISPKVTLAVRPVEGIKVYGTYAEGYRAPSTTETLMDGLHPTPSFNILPNPNLIAETAHNWEAGVNFKYDGILTQNDAFRGKVSAFRNRIKNYIDASYTDPNNNSSPCDLSIPLYSGPNAYPACFSDDQFQYVNIGSALIQGVELEASYDARSWFAILAAQHVTGENEDTGANLITVIPDRVVGTLGFRFLDEKLVVGTRVSLVDASSGSTSEASEDGSGLVGSVYPASDSYALVDLFASYQFNEAATLTLNVDNLFDKEYLQYLNQENSPGLNARIGLTMRFGAE